MDTSDDQKKSSRIEYQPTNKKAPPPAIFRSQALRTVRQARFITGLFEFFNWIGIISIIIFGIMAAQYSYGSAQGGIILVTILSAFAWWIVFKLMYISLQLMADISENIHELQEVYRNRQ